MDERIHAAFEAVHAGDHLKAAALTAIQKKNRKFSWKKLSVAVSFAVLCLVVGLGFYVSRTPVSYISIDVNPSIELELSRFDRVLSATAYNEDGEAVLEQLDLEGALYTDAIKTLLASPAMQSYLKEDALVTFTVAAESGKKEAALLAGTRHCTNLKAESYCADVGSLAEAHECGLSFGKYAAYQVLAEYDDTVTADDCQNMTMSELHDQIEHHAAQSGGEQHHNRHGNHNTASTEPAAEETTETTTEAHGKGHHHNRS